MIDPVTSRTSLKAAAAAAALERAADGATEELAVLQAEVAARDAELERLQDICDERQRVIEELNEHASTYRRAAEERAGLVAAIDFDLQRLRGDLERAERERTDAVAAAERAMLELDDERQRARLLAGERDAELRAAHRDAETLRARVAVLQEGLAGRVGLVTELQDVCDERLGVIERLSQEVAELRTVAEERLGVIDGLSQEVAELRTVAEERQQLLEANESKYRELAAAADAREAAAQASTQAEPPVPDDGVDWRAVAEERDRALQHVSAEAERRAVLLAELTAALEGRTREVEDLRKRLTRAF